MNNCPHCGAPIEEMSLFCSNCGANIQEAREQKAYTRTATDAAVDSVSAAVDAAKIAGQKRNPFVFGADRKSQLFNDICEDAELSDNAYCGWLGGMVVYGLVVNMILCFIFDRYTSLFSYFFTSKGYLVFIGLYFGLCITGVLVANATVKPIISFIGYNMIVLPIGLLVAISVYIYGGVDSPVVAQALLITVIVTMVMTALSIAKPDIFSSLGKTLGVSLLALLAVSAVSYFTRREESIIWTYAGAGIFSLYIGFDIYRAMQYPKTKNNAINCAIEIYMDIINLFLRILRILAKANSKRR